MATRFTTTGLRPVRALIRPLLVRLWGLLRADLRRRLWIARQLARWPSLDARLRSLIGAPLPGHGSGEGRAAQGGQPAARSQGRGEGAAPNPRVIGRQMPGRNPGCGKRRLYWLVGDEVCLPSAGSAASGRHLGQALAEKGEQVVFVAWDQGPCRLAPVDGPDLQDVATDAAGGAPCRRGEAALLPVHEQESGHWLIMAGLPSIGGRSSPAIDILLEARRCGLRVAFLFDDASFPKEEAEDRVLADVFAERGSLLLLGDLVATVTERSATGLRAFLETHEMATASTLPEIRTLSSPPPVSTVEPAVQGPRRRGSGFPPSAEAREMSLCRGYAQAFSSLLDEAADPARRMGNVFFWKESADTGDPLVRALRGIGVGAVPVGWDEESASFRHLGGENPAPLVDAPASGCDWLLVAGCRSYADGPAWTRVRAAADRCGLRRAVVLDSRDLREIGMDDGARRRAAEALAAVELLLVDTPEAGHELYGLLLRSRGRTLDVESRIRVCARPVSPEASRGTSPAGSAKELDPGSGAAAAAGWATSSRWEDYARDLVACMVTERPCRPAAQPTGQPLAPHERCRAVSGLRRRPLLSICITTYNRADWLAVSLRNLARILPAPRDEIELLVCDNESTDHTSEVVKPFLSRSDFRYHRNATNVGMLGNLRVTANHARGQYIWLLGDDDLLMPDAVERVLGAIRSAPGVALLYLNYAYTRDANAKVVKDLDTFLASSTPVSPPAPDQSGPVHRISTQSENFFTAIYCLVFRRDHAVRAYSQNTAGRPFSSMLTCIPTTYYVLNHMMSEPGCWLGSPQLVVNLNVSWSRYAALWILERMPEVYDVAEKMGAAPIEVDRWRLENLVNVPSYFRQIFERDPDGNAEFFSPARLVARHKHLPEFAKMVPVLRRIYRDAAARRHPAASMPESELFGAFDAN